MSAAKVLRLPPPEMAEETKPREIIEDYLDHLCGPLIGIVPYIRRERLRQEARYNIEERASLYERDGLNPEEAALKACTKYGDTAEISESFLEEWIDNLPKGKVAKSIGLPMSYAVFFFTQAYLWGIVLLQYRMFFPESTPMDFGISVPQFRKFWPEPLPLPENNPLWGLLWLYSFLAPIIAGWLTGTKAMIRAGRSVVAVQVCLVLLTFVVGTIMLPLTEGLWLAMLQLVWWVPMGTLTSHIAGALARRRRFRFQPTWRMKSL